MSDSFGKTRSAPSTRVSESLTQAIHSISTSIDLFEFAEDILEQTQLKKKIKNTCSNPAELTSLESFKLFSHKLDQNLMAHLRLILINNQDIKENREIASFVFDDFKRPISVFNEKKCKQALRQVIEFQLSLNHNLKSQLDKNALNILEKNQKLIEYLQRSQSQLDPDQLNAILENQPLHPFDRLILRNIFVSLLDNRLLENNLKYLTD